MNKGKKALAVLSTAALFGTTPAAVALPFFTTAVAHAATAASLSALSTPTVPGTASSTQLGIIKIVVPAGGFNQSGDQVTFRLPSGVTANTDFTTSSTLVTTSNSVYVLPDQGSFNNGLTGATVSVTPVTSGKEYTIQVKNLTSANLVYDSVIYVVLGNIKLDGAGDGPLNVSFDAPSTSGFPTGTVTVANVNSAGTVSVSAVNTTTSNNTFTFDLRIKENIQGALKKGTNTLKLKLPNGYQWNGLTTNATLVYGDLAIAGKLQVTPNQDELDISLDNSATESQASLIDLPLSFYVSDPSVVSSGDITATVSGLTSVDNSQLVVGTYGDYGATVSAPNPVNAVAGQSGIQLGDIVVTESIKGSLVSGRTITLTLPDGVEWERVYDWSTSGATLTQPPLGDLTGTINTTGSLQISTVNKTRYIGDGYRTLVFTVDGASQSNGATFKLSNAQIAVRPDFSGDINVTVGGSAGVSGTVKVASVQAPVSVTASNTTNFKIGISGQSIGDLTLTESAAGALSKGKTVALHLPSGVTWASTPSVSVTSGDLSITNVRTSSGDLLFDVNSESTKPSTVKITGGQVTVDNTVAAGPIKLKVQGSAVAATASFPTWSTNNTVASTVLGYAGNAGTNAVFTVGSTSFTVNGQQQTMDVAPYLKNDGRVMLPVRFVANALGVNDNNIIWNGADQSVTIFKGNTVAKMTVGSNTMVVNGVAVQMDVAPELYNDGRVMLPIRWIGQALGAQLSWDQTTQTVTVTAQ